MIIDQLNLLRRFSLHVRCACVKGGPSQLMGRVCGDAQVLMRRVLERPITIRLVNSVIIEG